jgi:hypothetical protein
MPLNLFDERTQNMLEWLGSEGEELHRAFRTVFGEGFPFGSPSLRTGGLSDGGEGVQWSAGLDPQGGRKWVGVNLEGMKYDGWPVARLIRRELDDPTLPGLVRRMDDAERIEVLWARDFWQAAARPRIMEAQIRPTPIPLGRLGEEAWRRALDGALACLDETRDHLGRATQQVTLESSRRRVEGPVSPHLTFTLAMHAPLPWETFLHDAKPRMQPLHDWVAARAAPLP